MEQECMIAGLYQSLGISIGSEFSSKDVSVLFHKVFHVPSTPEDAHVAIRKLYWDLQLLNAGQLNTLYMMNIQNIIGQLDLDCMCPHIHTATYEKAHNRSDTRSVLSCSTDKGHSQKERLAEKREQPRTGKGVWRLRRAARQSWARLAAEGLHSIFPSLWQCELVRGQTWGCVSLSDLLLLVEVKYDVVTHMLYTEMLQEHHSLSVWETLLPWQQDEEEEGLEDLAEEALESGDMLCLAELPGAFRVYRASDGRFFKGGPDSRERSWSAINLLCEIHASRQQERDVLTALSRRLDKEALRLLCLHIRSATVRAQREKMSYAALLAARQSWETWPCVRSPCKTEQAALWLQSEEDEGKEKKDFISASLQQAVLHWLVLTQEQERKYLLKLLHGVSQGDLQGPGGKEPSREEDKERHNVLREGCISRLKQIHNDLQTHMNTQIQKVQNSHQPQPKSLPQTLHTYKSFQPQIQAQTQIGSTAGGPKSQWDACAVMLLTQLMELQEVQVAAVISAMLDMNAQRLRALRDKYDSEVQEQRLATLLQLLTSAALLTSDSLLIADPTLNQNSSTEQITAQDCRTGPLQAQNSSTGPLEAPNSSTADSIGRARREPNQAQAADGIEKQDVCTGCGVAMEDLPYLEILCVSEVTNISSDGHTAERGGAQEGQEEGSPRKTPQNYEKQGSLITLAWSKPREDDTDHQTEAEVRGTTENQNAVRSMKTMDGIGDVHNTAEQNTHCEEMPGDSHMKVSHPSLFTASSTQRADQQCSTEGQLLLKNHSAALEQQTVPDQPENRETTSDSDLPTHALVAETLEVGQPYRLAESLEIKQHDDDPCSDLSNETANVSEAVDRVHTEVEMNPTQMQSELWDLKEPEQPHHEDQKYTSQATVDSSFSEKETTRESVMMERDPMLEPVSVMERERTMRSLVDMQRKVEQRQQRDRERQLLRVQERLTIIQNRKAEEDLLGLKQSDRLRHVTDNLPQEDKSQQKTVVRERLEQLRRERSYVMQSKRDRNTAGFKELLGPVALQSTDTEDGGD
ncbi:uncharacterized protein LOC115360574 [Myripristis murdjan]|uniref:uncharacterized protein LOC115360574 n=1 Tax=Myripristis murdjan TaxID=586833 RepID=UPI001175D771|nr:uncharacterized protein LOC115360574 [Myripristis murdjan]